jgi:glycosyltransferase involved in cell wall biosynthesis
MPKVLRIINRFNLGGPTYNAAYLTKYLADEFQTMLVGGEKDETEDSSQYIVRDLGIEPVVISEMRRSINPFQDLAAFRKIKSIINSFKPDIVHTHASKAGTLGRLAAMQSNVPVIIHTFHGHVFHSYFNSYKSKFFQNVEHNLAKKSSKIIAISDKQKEDLAEKYKIARPEKIEVIPLGFDLDRFQEDIPKKRLDFRRKFDIADDELAIGIIGRLVPVKNHELFLQAVKYVKEHTNKKIRAFIIGDGECRQNLKNRSNELNIDFADENSVNKKATLTFTSWIKKIDEAYAGLDIVALTSHNEGTPVSLIEAQASNKPIVTTNVGGIENIVIPDKTALLSSNNDVKDFSEKLLSVTQNDNLRMDMSHEDGHTLKISSIIPVL